MMPRYKVLIEYKGYVEVEVEAEDLKDAAATVNREDLQLDLDDLSAVVVSIVKIEEL